MESSASLPAGLYWGVKRSFLRYIAMLPDGGYEASEGAALVDDAVFRFVPATDDADEDVADGAVAEERIFRFRGSVLLQGHGRLLRVRIADPWFHFGPNGSRLSVCDPVRRSEDGARLVLAGVTASRSSAGDVRCWTDLPVHLDAAGVSLFGGQYDAGEELSPVTIIANQQHC